jgi:hypothetical protein
MRIRRHLSYANVTATVALFVALGGGAYAVSKVDSRDIANDSVKSVDLKNRRAVTGPDVKRNALTGRQISEATLNAARFAPVVGQAPGDCNPTPGTSSTICAQVTMRLNGRSRVLAIATGGQESVNGAARAICEFRVDGKPEPVPVQPGEEATDNTSSSATNGFARTLVTKERLTPGPHRVALACNELSGNVRIDAPTIAAIAIGSG